MSRSRKTLGRGLLIVLGLLVADTGARAWFLLAGEAYDGSAVRSLASAAVGGVTTDSTADSDTPEVELPWQTPRLGGGKAGALLPHPYFGYEFRSRADSIARFQALSRTPEWKQLEHSAKPYIVLVVGGSVARGFTDLDVGGMDRFEEVLMGDPRFAGRTLAVLGQGRSGYKQPQQLAVVTWLLGAGLTPDAVINLDGFNEVAFGMSNAEYDAHPLYPWFGYWTRIAGTTTAREAADQALDIRELNRDRRNFAAWALRLGAHRSCIAGTFARLRIQRFEQRRLELAESRLNNNDDSTHRGPLFDGTDDEVMRLVVRNWLESSRSLFGLLSEREIVYVHALQPTLHDEGSKPVTAEELAQGSMREASMRGVRLGYPLLREAGAELRALGVPFVDCSGVFRDVPETLYVDSCHFVKPGNEILADALAAALLDAIPD